MRLQDPRRDPFDGDGGETEEGHLPVLVEEVVDDARTSSRQPPDRRHRRRRWAHRADPGGVSTPDGRLLGLDADGAAIARVARAPRPRSAIGWSCARRTSASSATVAPGGRASAPVDGILFDLGLSSFQLADARARLQLPGRRPARHALRHEPRRPGRRAPRDPRRRRADGALPPLRRGAVRRPHRPGHRRRPPDAPRSTTAEELAALVERVVPPDAPERRRDPPGDAGLPGAADRGQRGARRARSRRWPRPSTCSGPVAASWS